MGGGKFDTSPRFDWWRGAKPHTSLNSYWLKLQEALSHQSKLVEEQTKLSQSIYRNQILRLHKKEQYKYLNEKCDPVFWSQKFGKSLKRLIIATVAEAFEICLCKICRRPASVLLLHLIRITKTTLLGRFSPVRAIIITAALLVQIFQPSLTQVVLKSIYGLVFLAKYESNFIACDI